MALAVPGPGSVIGVGYGARGASENIDGEKKARNEEQSLDSTGKMSASVDAKEVKLTIRQRRSKGSDLSIVTGTSPACSRGAKPQAFPARKPLKVNNAVTEVLNQREALLRENEFRFNAHRSDQCIQELTQPGPLTSRMLAWDGVPFTPLILNRK
ncbi:hypothetical protein KEM54_001516, partial [Ascosphaera aggregata]